MEFFRANRSITCWLPFHEKLELKVEVCELTITYNLKLRIPIVPRRCKLSPIITCPAFIPEHDVPGHITTGYHGGTIYSVTAIYTCEHFTTKLMYSSLHSMQTPPIIGYIHNEEINLHVIDNNCRIPCRCKTFTHIARPVFSQN